MLNAPSTTLKRELAYLQTSDNLAQTRVQVRVPKIYHSRPLINNLVSHHNLVVNINGALLGANGQEDGWFDLQLQGQTAQIVEALLELVDLGADVWLGFCNANL
ncbi:MAG: NIL domain-containing protein [Leptolyngbyaceae bacterium]|nr:NIL domain-containing protein [Leptolyngbyaceae bacterium]